MRYRLWPDHLDISAPTFKAWPYGRKQTAFVDERCPKHKKTDVFTDLSVS